MLRKFPKMFFGDSVFFVSILSLAYMLYFLFTSVKYVCDRQVCDLSIISTYFHDFVYHGAVASAAFKALPFRLPVFAGESMQGYHYLYNLLLSFVLSLGVQLPNAYWHVMPVLYYVAILFLLQKFSKRIDSSPIFLTTVYFFYFFGGTASYVATLIFKKSVFGYGVSSLLHTSTMFLYPTVAYSMILMFVIWMKLFDKNSLFRALQIGVILFLLMGTKFYAGATMMVIVFVDEIIWHFRKNCTVFINLAGKIVVYLVCILLALYVFYNFPYSLNKEPVFGWAPLAAVHQVIEDEYSYPLKNIAMARDTLYSMGKFSPRLIVIESGSILLFIFHHFGTRILGFLYLLRLILSRKSSRVDIAMFVGVVFSFLCGILFVQRGAHWWNALQFHYYTAVILTIYTARFVYESILSNVGVNRIGKFAIISLICITTIPNAIEKMIEFQKTSRHVISSDELKALNKLSSLADGIVFTVPLIADTAYISAFSGKTVYYADEQMLQNNGINYEARQDVLRHPESIDLNSINAKYVYLLQSDPMSKLFYEKAKGTSYVEIYRNKSVVLLLKSD